MENNKTADALKHLLSICNDGKEGYKRAAENINTGELKALLTTYSIQRSEFAGVLKTYIHQMNESPDNENGGTLGILHRTWIDIKTALTGSNTQRVLDACITGERAALEAYDEALENENLDPDIQQILMQQRSQIHEALHHIQKLEHQDIF